MRVGACLGVALPCGSALVGVAFPCGLALLLCCHRAAAVIWLPSLTGWHCWGCLPLRVGAAFMLPQGCCCLSDCLPLRVGTAGFAFPCGLALLLFCHRAAAVYLIAFPCELALLGLPSLAGWRCWNAATGLLLVVLVPSLAVGIGCLPLSASANFNSAYIFPYFFQFFKAQSMGVHP